MEFLFHLDYSLFFLINRLPHPLWADTIFLFFSFYPLLMWLFIGSLFLWYEFSRAKRFFVPLLVSLIVSGVLISVVLKPFFARSRPDIIHTNQVVVVSEKSSWVPWNIDYSFPSGHAGIAIAGATILGIQKKTYRKFFFLFALLTCFSRIYLGKHYPLDVLAGGLVGYAIAFLSLRLFRHDHTH